MRLSTKAQYAVRAMVSLNLHDEGSPVSLKDISGREEISLSYLEQLFVKLARVGPIGMCVPFGHEWWNKPLAFFLADHGFILRCNVAPGGDKII